MPRRDKQTDRRRTDETRNADHSDRKMRTADAKGVSFLTKHYAKTANVETIIPQRLLQTITFEKKCH